MLNKLRQMLRHYNMIQPGDQLICAISGGADSVALLFAMYLLREKLNISLAAAHFNHCLRGEESDRDECFVRQFCERLDIPLYVGAAKVVAGKKGIEAAAREVRYDFLKKLPGKIATAHTANDNLETVLMHLVRGTGLNGLGGIAPVNGKLIRPMLEITRDEVLSFLREYNLTYVTDSTNAQDCFFRNRLRQRVVPLLENENPNLAVSVSQLAQRLRADEKLLQNISISEATSDIYELRKMNPAIRSRIIRNFLEKHGVREPESKDILGVEKLVFSEKPSSRLTLRNGIIISRCYNRLDCAEEAKCFDSVELTCPGKTFIPEINLAITCKPATSAIDSRDRFTVVPVGKLIVRHRLPGDSMRLPGGTKDLRKLFIDKKIPAAKRSSIPVIVDDLGVIAVYGFGANKDRISKSTNAIEIRFDCLGE